MTNTFFTFGLNVGLPCKHALSCISYLRLQVEEFCDNHYSKAYYQLAYSNIIHLVPDLTMVDMHENPEDIVVPRRLSGRSRGNRRRQIGEGPIRPGTTRRSSTVRSDTYKQFGHNNRTYQ